MKRYIRFISAITAAAIISSALQLVTFASNDVNLIVNESFNECATNGDIPESITKNGDRIIVSEYKKGEKGVLISTLPKTQSLSFASELTGEYFISFDLSANKDYSGKVVLDMGSVKRTVIELENGNIKTHNGKSIHAAKGNVCIAVNQARNSYSLYINGTCAMSDVFVASFKFSTVRAVAFEFSSNTEAEVILDNVNIGLGKYKSSMKFPVSAYNTEEKPEVSFEMPPLSNTIYLYESFDPDKNSVGSYYNKDNILEKTYDEKDGGVCVFKRTGTMDAHLDIDDPSVTGDKTSSIIYEADLKLANSDTSVLFTLKDRHDKYFDYALVNPNGYLTAGNYTYKLPVGKWVKISLCYNLYQSTYTIYVDGKLAIDSQIYNGEYNHDSGFIWRIHAQGNGSDDCYYLDNLAIYGGDKPRDITSNVTEVRTEFEDKFNILRSEDEPVAYMKDKVGYHIRSGVVYSQGEKSMAENIVSDGTTYVAKEFFDTAYPGRIAVNGVDISVDGKLTELKAVNQNGKTYLPLRGICEKGLGKYVLYDGTCIHSGMIVISDTPTSLPEGGGTITSAHDDSTGAYMMHCSPLQNLNDLLFFRRPQMSVIKEDYDKSELKGVHPRILLDKNDFDAMRKNVKTDSRMTAWYSGLLTEADKLLNQDALIYELRDGVRLWQVANDFVSRMMVLSLAYQLTSDKKYADRGYTEMKAIADFAGWHPEHHIDVAAMGIGYAIGYDWLYDTYTQEQREYLEKRAYDNFYTEYIKGFEGLSCDMADGISFNNNHNAVMNGGSVIMANAFMDIYPEASSYLISGSIRATENMLYNFAPLGNWYEGVAYGTMTLRFLAYMMATMDKIYHNEYTIDKAQGLNQAAEYCIYMQGPAGPYSFSDSTSNGASRAVVLEPSMLWFANYYNTPSVQTTWFRIFHYAATGDSLARLMLWYNPDFSRSRDSLDIDKIYNSINVEVMRNNWMPIGQTMVGIKGGKANVEHGHMDMGSFGFFSGETRWIDDIGADDYDLPQFFYGFTQDGKRWSYFRERAEAHSCLVIAPDAKGGEYDPNETAYLTPMENKPKGATAQIDMTKLFGESRVKAAKRGFFFTDDRQSLVVRDEVTLTKKSDVYWFAYTNENVTIDGKSVILESTGELGKKARIDFLCDTPFELSADVPKPLEETKSLVQCAGEKGTRITLKTNAQGKLNITAKITLSDTENPSDISEYNMPIDEWRVPDGNIKIKPYLDSLYAGDMELSTSSSSQDVLIDEDETPPHISATSELFNVSVSQGAKLGDEAVVTVTDKNDASNVSVYKIKFKTLTPTGYPNVKEYTIKNLTVSDEPQAENCARNVLDRNLDTRWSADGAQSMTLDLGRVQNIDKVIMAFMDGNSRKYNISISVSNDDSTYTQVYDGTSSGLSNDYEAFDIGNQNARYVKIIGNGHDSGTWDSWTEVAVAKTN